MNMQGLQYTSIVKDHSTYFCIDGPLICQNCRRPLRKLDVQKTRQLMIMRDLRDVSEAKNNIRSTLKLEMKRNPHRSHELEFLMKRL